MKLLGIVLLSIASIAVLVGMVLPVAASLTLGLGIDIPNFWARSGKAYLILPPLKFFPVPLELFCELALVLARFAPFFRFQS